MLSETAYLALLLDAPMQSWGFESRFQRRTTGLHPTKSGVIGLICAAMGLAKGSEEERTGLPDLAKLRMTSIAIPRTQTNAWSGQTEELFVRRLEDYHTVLKTRLASGKENKNAVITKRQYLFDARFGVILEGNRHLLEQVANKLRDPVWGVWFGRKSCIPAEPICRKLCDTQTGAQQELIGSKPLSAFTVVSEVERFDEGTDSLCDQPVRFGDGTSSGPDKRKSVPRRIRIETGRSMPVADF